MRLRQEDHELQYYQIPLDIHFIWGETAHLSITIDKKDLEITWESVDVTFTGLFLSFLYFYVQL